MFNSAWLDIAIGVVMVWFLFALAVSAANEAVVKILALRSKQLWSALRQMLDGTESPQGILRNLAGLPARKRPSSPYPAANAPISARLYATQTMQALEIRSKDTQKTRIEHIPASIFSHSLIELALSSGPAVAGVSSGPAVAGVVEGAPETFDQVKGYIDGLPAGPLRAQLQAVMAGVGNDVTQFRDGVEHWFDGQMTRLSRLYRAQVQIILIFLGLVVAIVGFGFGLRSDALQLVGDLQHDQNLRSVVVGAASTATRNDLAQAADPPCRPDENPAACQLRGVSKLDNLNFVLRGDAPHPSDSFGKRLGFILPWRHPYALLGVLITGVAISFGSSFWFALLKRLVGLRGSGGSSSS